MNVNLLSVLVAQDGQDIIAKIDVERFFELKKQAEGYKVVGGAFYHIFYDYVKEIPPVNARHEILHNLLIWGLILVLLSCINKCMDISFGG